MDRFVPTLEDAVNRHLDRPGYRPAALRDLARALRLEGDARRQLRAVLRRLEAAGTVVRLRKNRWARPPRGRQAVGELRMHHRGFGFVTEDGAGGREVFVPEDALGGAIHGDRVVVALDGSRDRGRVSRVVARRFGRLAGVLRRTPYYWYLIPEDSRFTRNVRIRELDPAAGEPREGFAAVVELDPWRAGTDALGGRLVEQLGGTERPDVAIRGLMRQYGFGERFPDGAERAARAVPAQPGPPDVRGRRDLRGLCAFTIDPEDAKDFDDAVSLERGDDGDWRLGVHIADVAHFVRPGDAVDAEARVRGTSVYLVDRTITMLPPYLTAEVCSLQPEADRLTHSVEIRLDARGAVAGWETFPSVIRSRARLDYAGVQRFLDGQEAAVPAALRDPLRAMHELSRLRRARRVAAGALEFTLPEVRCVLDAEGRVKAVVRRGEVEAYRLIEEFMLLANEGVARRLARSRGPALYRVHDAPDPAQWSAMAEELAALGIGSLRRDRERLNEIVRRTSAAPLAYPIALAILRNLKRAEYSPEHRGHFGLAMDDYTHFTSPIRRYPDLVVHRLLDAVERRTPPPHGHDEVAEICRHCSRAEREADQAETESVEIKRIEYYAERLRLGATGPFAAVVVQSIPRGLLVELRDTLQRGLVAFADLGRTRGAPARGAGRNRRAATARAGRRGAPAPGDLLDVAIVRVDRHRRLVDFRPARP